MPMGSVDGPTGISPPFLCAGIPAAAACILAARPWITRAFLGLYTLTNRHCPKSFHLIRTPGPHA